MARIIYGGQLANLCLLSKDLLNFEPPYRKCWLRPWFRYNVFSTWFLDTEVSTCFNTSVSIRQLVDHLHLRLVFELVLPRA